MKYTLLNRFSGSRVKLLIRMASSDIKSVIFLGTPNVAANSLLKLSKDSAFYKFNITAVVTQPPAKSGRKKQLLKSPVHEMADSLSIPVYHPEKASDVEFLSSLEALSPDLCITAAYGNYLPKRFLSIPKYGTINIHPSLLPKYRGAAPVQRCLEAGDKETGVTVLTTVSKMDAGPILYQYKCNLDGSEKATDLLDKLFEIGTQELLNHIPSVFDKSIIQSEQDETQVSYAPKLNVNESRIDFHHANAESVHNKVRGFAEWPGVWTMFQFDDPSSPVPELVRVKLITTVVLGDALEQQSNTSVNKLITLIKHETYGFMLKLQCSDGSVLGIIELQPSNKKVMKARDLVNGLRGKSIYWASPPIDDDNDGISEK